MTDQKRKNKKYLFFGIVFCLVAAMTISVGFAVKYLLEDDGPRRKRQIQMISVVKPPPPPKIKEKPPEPEVKKKEEIIEETPEETPPDQVEDKVDDSPPPGEDLGVDAEGGAGGDAFGLVGKKGGRALIGGGSSQASLIQRYAWYTRIIQEELRKRMNHLMEENGGIPEGDLKALVQIKLDDTGRIVDFSMARSSGNKKMDDALSSALKLATISEPPPSGMPRVLKLKISAKG